MNKPEGEPLYCDACHKPIKYIEDAWVEWLEDANARWYGLRIVHHWRPGFSHSCHRREPEGSWFMDNHLARLLWRFKDDPEEGDDWYRHLTAGDSAFRPYVTMERLRAGAMLPHRPAADLTSRTPP